jgi:hypothetical protein
MTKTELAILLPAMLGSKEYVILSPAQLRLITSIADHAELCHIEWSKETVRWTGELLPELAKGSARLWDLNFWLKTDNKLKELRKKAAAMQAEWEAKKLIHAELVSKITNHFLNIGLPKEIIQMTIIGKSDTEKLQAIWDGLEAAGYTN